jgi:hypothetical protein
VSFAVWTALLAACSSNATPAAIDAPPVATIDAAPPPIDAPPPPIDARPPDAAPGACPPAAPVDQPDPTCSAGQVCGYSDWSCTCDPSHAGWVCDQPACPTQEPLPEPCTAGQLCDVYFGHICTCVASTNTWQCCSGPPPACPAEPPQAGSACCSRPDSCEFACANGSITVCRCGVDDQWSCFTTPC